MFSGSEGRVAGRDSGESASSSWDAGVLVLLHIGLGKY